MYHGSMTPVAIDGVNTKGGKTSESKRHQRGVGAPLRLWPAHIAGT
jgi:hypothetical protein